MRELKFRAWNGIRMAQCPGLSTFEEDDGLLRFRNLKGEDLVLMQFTGLKDKNGKEIYEGDFLKRTDDSIVVIKWEQNAHSFEWFSVKLHNRFWNSDAEDWQMSEVIGNIYESPALLTP